MLVGVILDLIQPLVEVLERLAIGDVVYHQGDDGSSVIRAND